MSEIKLKNCPFCGGEAEMGFRDASAFVMCTAERLWRVLTILREKLLLMNGISGQINRRKPAGHEKMSRVMTVKQSKMGLLSVADAKKRFLCRQIRLITARTAEQECTRRHSHDHQTLRNLRQAADRRERRPEILQRLCHTPTKSVSETVSGEPEETLTHAGINRV